MPQGLVHLVLRKSTGILCHVGGAGISSTLGMGAVGAGSPSATACNWVIADILRRVASGTSLVRSCRWIEKCPPVLRCSRLLWPPGRPPQRLGKHCLSSYHHLVHYSASDTIFVCLLEGIGCGCAMHLGLFNDLGSLDFVQVSCQFHGFKFSSLWQRSLEDLTANSCSRVMFIFLCSGRSLSDMVQLVWPWGECVHAWLPLVSSAQWAGTVSE